MGVEGHIWYSFLDRVIPQSTWRNVFKKVIFDQTFAAPFYTLTYILGKKRNFQIWIYHCFFYFSRNISDRRTNILL
jgi:hypothetical protein